MEWVKERLLQFASDRLRIIVAELVDLLIVMVKDGRVEEFISAMPSKLHQEVARIVVSIIRSTLESVDQTPDTPDNRL